MAEKVYFDELEPGVIDSAINTLSYGDSVEFDPDGMYEFMNDQFGWW